MASSEPKQRGADRSDRVPVVVPDLGLAGELTVSLWLVPVGASVLEGDRIVELLAGAATVDLEAPVAGTVVVQCVDEDDVVRPGAVLAEIKPGADA